MDKSGSKLSPHGNYVSSLVDKPVMKCGILKLYLVMKININQSQKQQEPWPETRTGERTETQATIPEVENWLWVKCLCAYNHKIAYTRDCGTLYPFDLLCLSWEIALLFIQGNELPFYVHLPNGSASRAHWESELGSPLIIPPVTKLDKYLWLGNEKVVCMAWILPKLQ